MSGTIRPVRKARLDLADRVWNESCDAIGAMLAFSDAENAGQAGAAIRDIARERAAQIEREGHTPEHDDNHDGGEIAMAAALYAAPCPLYEVEIQDGQVAWRDPWPWWRRFWQGREQAGDPMAGRVREGDGRRKHDRRRQLVIAGALIVAEIERLDRAAEDQPQTPERVLQAAPGPSTPNAG